MKINRKKNKKTHVVENGKQLIPFAIEVKKKYSNCNGRGSLWVCVKNFLGIAGISEVLDQFGGSILLKKKQKKLLVGDRRVFQRTA